MNLKKYALTEHNEMSSAKVSLAIKTLSIHEKRVIVEVYATTLGNSVDDAIILKCIEKILDRFFDLKATLELTINASHKPESRNG